MHAVLLAAGRGSRMGSRTAEIPKALVSIGDGESILGRNIHNIEANPAISQLTLVAGYRSDQIEAFCTSCQGPIRPRVVVNRRFAETGPAHSLRLALEGMPASESAVMIGNGDTLFSSKLIAALLSEGDGAWLAVSESREVWPDDIVVSFSSGSMIAKAEKSRVAANQGLLSAGLVAVRGRKAVDELKAAVSAVCRREEVEGTLLAWHQIFSELAERRASANAIVIARSEWWEFDTEDCILRFAEPAVRKA